MQNALRTRSRETEGYDGDKNLTIRFILMTTFGIRTLGRGMICITPTRIPVKPVLLKEKIIKRIQNLSISKR